METFRELRKALWDQLGLARPEVGVAVAAQRSQQNIRRYVGKKLRHRTGKLFRRIGIKPRQHFSGGSRHRGELVAVLRAGVTSRDEGGVGGRASRARRVENLAGTVFLCHRDERLERLHHIQLAGLERHVVARHRLIGTARKLVRVHALVAQVLLQAHPGRRHLGHRSEFLGREIGELERLGAALADQKERIVRHHLAEAHQRRIPVQVVRFHHPHRPAPGDVDRAVEQLGHRVARHVGGQQVDIDALALIEAERMCRVVGRIKDRAEVLHEPDRHARRASCCCCRWARFLGMLTAGARDQTACVPSFVAC